MTTIADLINLPLQKMPADTISEYGNLVSASIPAVMCMTNNKINNRKLNILMSGFGVGLTYISSVLNIDNIKCFDVLNYKDKK